jgi:hypothetical protein
MERKTERLVIPLAPGEFAYLHIPLPLSEWEWTHLVNVLQAMKPGLVHEGSGEEYCHRCYGKNIAWSAPSPLWNEVMRGGNINGEEEYGGIVCPLCFAQIAESKGIAEMWRFDAQFVNLELITTTPEGRVWNAETWMWEEPVDV